MSYIQMYGGQLKRQHSEVADITFMDDFCRNTWIYPMKQKSEVFGHFHRFKVEVEKVTGRHVRCLRSDGGKEYFSDEFSAYL